VKKADEAVKERIAEIDSRHDKLSGNASSIAELNSKLDDLKAQSGQLEKAVNERSYWVRMLAELNNKFENDFIWLTQIEPLKNGTALSPALVATAGSSVDATGMSGSLFPPPGVLPPAGASTSPAAGDDAQAKFELRMLGLYRKNDEGQEVVYRFAKALAKSEFFDAPDIEGKLNDYCKAEAGVGEDRYAYKFEIRVPLKAPMKFKN